MDEYALDILASMVALEPHKRISCRMAMQHPYFDDLDKSKFESDFWNKYVCLSVCLELLKILNKQNED